MDPLVSVTVASVQLPASLLKTVPGIHVLCSTEVSVSLGTGDGVTIPCFKAELINSLHTLAPKVPAQRPTLPGSVVLPRTVQQGHCTRASGSRRASILSCPMSPSITMWTTSLILPFILGLCLWDLVTFPGCRTLGGHTTSPL